MLKICSRKHPCISYLKQSETQCNTSCWITLMCVNFLKIAASCLPCFGHGWTWFYLVLCTTRIMASVGLGGLLMISNLVEWRYLSFDYKTYVLTILSITQERVNICSRLISTMKAYYYHLEWVILRSWYCGGGTQQYCDSWPFPSVEQHLHLLIICGTLQVW